MKAVLPDTVDRFLREIVEPDRPLTCREVARLLGLHPNTVKRIDHRELPWFAATDRGDRRYAPDDVRLYIARRRPDPRVPPCECQAHPCPRPSKPGVVWNGLLICWRCKGHR